MVDGDIRIGKNYEYGICRLRMDADIDAANSILARGMSAVGVGTPAGRNMARISLYMLPLKEHFIDSGRIRREKMRRGEYQV